MSLGNAIKSLRKEMGLSQEALSLLAEIDLSYLGRVERGDNNVTVFNLLKLAHALDVSLERLAARAEL